IRRGKKRYPDREQRVGFVEMGTPEEAQKAKEALDGTDFLGRALKIDAAKPQEKKEFRGGDRGDRGERRPFRRNRDF
ncbi:MAG TPA: hypothetical protein PKG81_07200, partial [Candidatus Omnitrophota bacterium]|nr:hypothetical protein [Candidatus Omnitrophota bacterium]